MGEVKRHGFISETDKDGKPYVRVFEHPNGCYVRSDDYATLEAERDALRKRDAYWLKLSDLLGFGMDSPPALLGNVRARLDHNDALWAEVASLRAACAAKDGALGICQDMLTFVNESSKQYKSSVVVALRTVAAALSTDAGKGWIDATGAVEATVQHIGANQGVPECFHVSATVPADWAGSRILIARVAK